MARAHALATTSVGEGFGLAFLEPWLVKRPLAGRNLPEITAGFDRAGVDLSGLYRRVDVPVEWLGMEALRERTRRAMTQSLAAYGRTPAADALDQALASAVCGGLVDFGRLDEPLQESVIRHLADSAEDRRLIRPAALEWHGDAGRAIERNHRAVTREFSLATYGERLMSIYRAVVASETSEPKALNAGALLDRFLAPERFSLLRALQP